MVGARISQCERLLLGDRLFQFAYVIEAHEPEPAVYERFHPAGEDLELANEHVVVDRLEHLLLQILEQKVRVVEQVERGLVRARVHRSLLETVLRNGAQAEVADGLHVGDRLLVLVFLLVGFVLFLLAAPVKLLLFERPV